MFKRTVDFKTVISVMFISTMVLFIYAGYTYALPVGYRKHDPAGSKLEGKKNKAKYAVSEVLVGLKEGSEEVSLEAVAKSVNIRTKSVERLHDIKSKVEDFRKNNQYAQGLSDEHVLKESYGKMQPYERALYRGYKIKLSADVSVEKAISNLEKHPDVEYVEPNYLYEKSFVPNDPYYSSSGSWGQSYDDLWGLKKIQSADAWDLSFGDNVVVAVIDTGVDYNHEDIKSNIWKNTKEIADNNIDDDKNGYVDDIRGWDFSGEDETTIIEDKDPMDTDGHGSHVAGTIGAIGNNAIGVIGVSPKAKIMPVKVFPNAYTDVLVKAIKYAVDNGARVTNSSWGSGGTISKALRDAFKYAHGRGVVSVVAAGNYNLPALVMEPANYNEVITVAATDDQDKKASFSNYWPKIDVAAPGVGILSLKASCLGQEVEIPGTNYTVFQGTSMSSPHVAGLAAAILYRNPAFSNEEVRQAIRKSTNDVGIAGWDIYSSYGRINSFKAVNPTIAYPVAYISSIKIDKLQKTITINGSANCDSFSSFKIEYGRGVSPTVWKTVTTSTVVVTNGVLGTIDITNLDEGQYVFKLAVLKTNAVSGEDKSYIYYNPDFVLEWSYADFCPWDVSVDEKNGFVYVAGTEPSDNFPFIVPEIVKFNTQGGFLKKWTVPESNHPVCVGPDGAVWTLNIVGDTDIVIKYDSNGNKIFSFGKKGIGEADFLMGHPDFDIDKNGNIYIFDNYYTTSRIKKFTSNGTFVKNIGSFGNGNGQFNQSCFVAVDDTYLYVSDTVNNRVQKFTTDGVFVGTIGSAGQGNGQFKDPVWAATDYLGNVYVADCSNFRVQAFDKNGKFLDNFGALGIGLFEGENRGPYGIYVDKYTPRQYAYVMDMWPYHMQKFKIDTTAPTLPLVIDSGVYNNSAATLSANWVSSEPESGIVDYQYCITQDSINGTIIKNWTSTGGTPLVIAIGLTLLQGKTYYFGVKAKNRAGLWSAIGYSDGIKVDTTASSKPLVTDEGAYTNNITTLKASWSSFDFESGIKQYQYRITQDSTAGIVIRDWTSTGSVSFATDTGLRLIQGKTYYFSVKAMNGSGLWSVVGYSNGIRVNTPPTAPTITGPSSGSVNIAYSFTAQSSDADADTIHLNFIFLGTDGLEHLVAIWYNNQATQSYSWNKAGSYYIKVSAEDEFGGASTWTKKDIMIR